MDVDKLKKQVRDTRQELATLQQEHQATRGHHEERMQAEQALKAKVRKNKAKLDELLHAQAGRKTLEAILTEQENELQATTARLAEYEATLERETLIQRLAVLEGRMNERHKEHDMHVLAFRDALVQHLEQIDACEAAWHELMNESEQILRQLGITGQHFPLSTKEEREHDQAILNELQSRGLDTRELLTRFITGVGTGVLAWSQPPQLPVNENPESSDLKDRVIPLIFAAFDVLSGVKHLHPTERRLMEEALAEKHAAIKGEAIMMRSGGHAVTRFQATRKESAI
jgi:hypothetical protein